MKNASYRTKNVTRVIYEEQFKKLKANETNTRELNKYQRITREYIRVLPENTNGIKTC